MSSRQAALLMHAASPADQAWLLAQLPDDEQALLRAHLAELVELGIPASSLPAVAPVHAAVAQPGTTTTDAREIDALMDNEPIWMQAQILAAGPWPWQEAWLASQDLERRKALSTYQQSWTNGLPSERAQACRDIVVARVAQLRQGVPASPASTHRPPQAAIGQWIRKWLP